VCRVFEPLPQMLRNVPVNGRDPLAARAVQKEIAAGEEKLGATGRLLVRESGTEPVVRIMVEGVDETLVGAVLDDIADVIKRSAG